MKRIYPAKKPYDVGWNAFINDDGCPYRPLSFYEREWHRGWNHAYQKNRESVIA